MTSLRFGPDALRASRFAISPLAETLSELAHLRRALDQPADSHRGADLGRWFAADPFAEGLIRLITSTKFLPDFVAIPPAGMHTRLEDELLAMKVEPDEAALATVLEANKHSWARRDLRWAETPGLAARAAKVLDRAWTLFVEPDWARRRTVMERDIRYRGGVIAVSGWRDALKGMATGLQWTGTDSIQFSAQTFADRQVGSTGLIFVPHTASDGRWTCETPKQIALVYRARGISSPANPSPAGITDLIGPGRARLLAELCTPATPSQLATVLGLSLGTVSSHLAVLVATGVCSKHRAGRAVYYELTATGEALVDLMEDTTRVALPG